MNKNIKEEGTSIDQTDDNNAGYNYLFFDNVHLNHRFGVALLKKIGCCRICYLAQTVEKTTTFHLTIKYKHIYSAVQMTLNMQNQTKSNSTGNTDSIRYMAQMFGNTNIIQIMLQMRHMLSIPTQLTINTKIIDDTTELKTVFKEA